MYARAAVYSVVAMGDWRQGRPLAARWGRRAVASTWPLMRNWDHTIKSIVGYRAPCKLATVNRQEGMGAQRLWLPHKDGEYDAVTWLYTVENCIFRRLEKFFTLWPAYKSFPLLLGQDFVVNFATYTRVYMVTVFRILIHQNGIFLYKFYIRQEIF